MNEFYFSSKFLKDDYFNFSKYKIFKYIKKKKKHFSMEE